MTEPNSRAGFVAVIGAPNAGKSSVFNALVREDRAIVTDIPGTTRDVIEGRTVMDGLVIRLRDTAGLRESEDVIEKLGVERTRQAMAEADITLAVLDGSLPLEPDDEALVRTVLGTDGIVVVNKSDLLQAFVPDPGWKAIAVSAKSGEGISKLEGAIGERLDGLTAGAKDQVLTNQRQLGCMERARDAFEFALRSATTGTPMDILAIDLKAAYAALGEITGETVGDTIIDEIFSRFCLGK
jgi:tRNA modification GTPase